MKLCHYGAGRLGWVEDGTVRDVTDALDHLPALRWPPPALDPLWAGLDTLRTPLEAAARRATPVPISDIRLLSPVPRPGKIVAARRNRGPAEAVQPDVFLKAPSSVVGPGEGIVLSRLERACECEIELAAVIGRSASCVAVADALGCVAGYCIALDLAVFGEEDRGLRKSGDSFCVLGPWVTTADEVSDPGSLLIELRIAAAVRQRGRVSAQTFSMAQIVSHASRFVTLRPGDVVLAGCPSGAVTVSDGDVLDCHIESLGTMRTAAVAAQPGRAQGSSSVNRREEIRIKSID